MRASRTRIIPEADAVAEAEGNKVLIAKARLLLSGGVCVVGMYENTQSRNLGGPIYSCKGKYIRNRLQEYIENKWEVRWLHSTEEAE